MCVVTTVMKKFDERQGFISQAIVDELARNLAGDESITYEMRPVCISVVVQIKRMIECGKINFVERSSGSALSTTAAILRLNHANSSFISCYYFIPTIKEIVLGIMDFLSKHDTVILVPRDAFIKKYHPPPPSRDWRI